MFLSNIKVSKMDFYLHINKVFRKIPKIDEFVHFYKIEMKIYIINYAHNYDYYFKTRKAIPEEN